MILKKISLNHHLNDLNEHDKESEYYNSHFKACWYSGNNASYEGTKWLKLLIEHIFQKYDHLTINQVINIISITNGISPDQIMILLNSHWLTELKRTRKVNFSRKDGGDSRVYK